MNQPWRNDLALSRVEMVNFLPLWQQFQWNDSLLLVGVELQGPHWQQSSLRIPWQPQPLAPWRSSSCGLARTEAGTCCCIPAGAAARRALQSLAGVWRRWEERAGHQLRLVVAESFRISSSALLPRCSSYWKLVLPASCWSYPALWGKSHLSHKALVGEFFDYEQVRKAGRWKRMLLHPMRSVVFRTYLGVLMSWEERWK